MELKNKSSQVLALQIVCYRTIGIGKEASVEAMSELLLRKEQGDNFDYESYIDEKIKAIPKPQADINKNDLLKNIIKNVKSGIN